MRYTSYSEGISVNHLWGTIRDWPQGGLYVWWNVAYNSYLLQKVNQTNKNINMSHTWAAAGQGEWAARGHHGSQLHSPDRKQKHSQPGAAHSKSDPQHYPYTLWHLPRSRHTNRRKCFTKVMTRPWPKNLVEWSQYYWSASGYEEAKGKTHTFM